MFTIFIACIAMALLSSCSTVVKSSKPKEVEVVEIKMESVRSAIVINSQEYALLNRVLSRIRSEHYERAIVELERILTEPHSGKGLKCIVSGLLAVVYLEIGDRKAFLAQGKETVERCRTFKRLPTGIRIVTQIYSNWSGEPIPTQMQADF